MSQFLVSNQPALVLAPMEGVTDAPMRAYMAQFGSFTYFVSEFLRVSATVPPDHVILDYVPELKGEAHAAGKLVHAAVQLQLLGGDPEKVAATAAAAVRLGARGIDLNFGCPAPSVNRHDGGAVLLRAPERLRDIVRAVRAAVPAELPVSAKMRLGWDDPSVADHNAKMIEEGGASWLTIHGRTKVQGYTPPAYWEPIGRIRRALSIPVVANGEIWTLDDLRRCRDQTGCIHFMVGRGILARPWLSHEFAREIGAVKNQGNVGAVSGAGADRVAGVVADANAVSNTSAKAWLDRFEHFVRYCQLYTNHPLYTIKRLKQWMRYAHAQGQFEWFDQAKRLETPEQVLELLKAEVGNT